MEATFENAVLELQKLIRINSVETPAEDGCPFGKGNAAALDSALALLQEFGFCTKNIENYCGYGEIGKGELFGILGHLDVVPESGDWKYPPFGGVIDGGRLYGRGAGDDKGPVVAAIFAAARLLQEGRTPKKRIRFILGSDEESGWLCMERYAKTEEMPVSGFSPDADFPVIHCEKGIVYHDIVVPRPKELLFLTAGTRANVVPDYAEAVIAGGAGLYEAAVSAGLSAAIQDGFLRLAARGKSAHGSHPEDGENALLKLLSVLQTAFPALRTLYSAFSDCNGRNVSLGISDVQSGKLTLNLGTAAAEGDFLQFSLDIRHPISYFKDDLTAILQRELPAFTVTQGAYHLPLYVPKDHPLVQTLLTAYDGVMGTKSEPIVIGGGTYARFLPLGVAFGPAFPGKPSTIHQADEYIDLKEFRLTIEIYYQAIKALCFD